MRLLPVIRLSLVTDNTTSPERQLGKIETYASLGDHELVEISDRDYDLDVSGAVSPFDRPGLGRWLKEDRLDMWDALCAAKLDRISRSLFDFTALLQWLEAHGKTLIILDPMLDLTKPEGRVMANVLMTFAEYERQVIGARVKDAYDKLIRDGRYTGGMVPFGYRPVKLARNWGYETDPEYGPLVAEMASRYLRYETLGSIARWLQESGVPSPKDVIRKRNGKPLKGTPWSTASVRIILSSPAVLGAVTNAKGEPLRDAQGVVVYRAPALISRDVYERIQVRLAQNAVPVRVNSTPLLQVAFCGRCGAPMHRTTTKKVWSGKPYEYAYYHCFHAHMRDGKCSAKRIKAGPLEEIVFDNLLEIVGDIEMTEAKLVPGRDYSEEMAKVVEQIRHLSGEVELGAALGRDVTQQQATLDAAKAELRRLGQLKPVPARIEPVGGGKTFRQRWEELDVQGRNAYLRESEIQVWAEPWGENLPHVLVLPKPASDQAVILFGEGMRIVIDLGKLEKLRQQAANA
jgi:site-specific DNA recombinase